MPFLAPLIGALPGILGAAAPTIASTVGGSLLGKLIGGPSNQQKDANTALQQLALSTGQKGLSFLDQSQGALAGPQNYFQSILSGSRGGGALAPDINQINSGFNIAKQNTAELTPRSGGRSTLFNELPFQKLGAINDLFSKARANAAQGATQLGLGEGSIGTSAATGGAGGIERLLSQLGLQQQSTYNTGKDIGSSIYNIAKSINWGDIFKKTASDGAT